MNPIREDFNCYDLMSAYVLMRDNYHLKNVLSISEELPYQSSVFEQENRIRLRQKLLALCRESRDFRSIFAMGCRSRGILNEKELLIDKLSILYISLCILLRGRHVMLARG